MLSKTNGLTKTRMMISKAAMHGVLTMGLIAGAQGLYAQYAPPRPVDDTIHHLQEVVERNGVYSGHERERYDHALRRLSAFQERAQHGYFDKGKLDQAIRDVKNVADHNPMDAHARDLLWHDLGQLRGLRSSYDHGFRY